MPAQKEKTITINDVVYKESELSETAKSQITNLHITDQEISRLNHQLAIAQTARVAYARALAEALPKAEASTAVQ